MFADVVVPIPLYSVFTYIVPREMNLEVGSLVLVPFGNGQGRIMTAVVVDIHNKPLQVSKFKKIIDELPHRLLPSQVDLLRFVSKYYSVPIGETYHQLLPAQLISRYGVPDSYKPRICNEYYLNPIYSDPAQLQALRESMCRAHARLEALDMFLDGVPMAHISSIRRSDLVRHGILMVRKVEVSRIDTTSQPTEEMHTLTKKQADALKLVISELESHETVLLHGVTSSGKTELYLKLILRVISQGKQVLFIVPESTLTQHLYDRLKCYFGKTLGVYHTQCSQEERMETYVHQLSETPYNVILGTKSSLFLPFKNLGLVIVDEEHDTNFKQTDHIPYYNARDVALYLAKIHKAKAILGSATPSVESYQNSRTGKYGYVRMLERYGNVRLPQVHIVDLAEEQRKKHIKGHFSQLLVTQINAALNAKHQVILFQKSRGFSPYVQCSKCGYVPKCPHCDVSLTYSKKKNMLSCTYCGHTQPYNIVCDACASAAIEPRGLGVEQLEEEAMMLFPLAKIVRHTTKDSAKILQEFHNGGIDILIGTRSIVKGIDYHNVEVFGIMNIDNMLNHPDFRANERAYQLFLQAAGRTGRRLSEGHLVLQTYHTDNPFLDVVRKGIDEEFYEQQLEERKMFNYPPYSRIIKIEVRHYLQNYCIAAIEYFKKYVSALHDVEVIGPVEPVVGYIGGEYVRLLIIKMLPRADYRSVKGNLQNSFVSLIASNGYEKGSYTIDIDPI